MNTKRSTVRHRIHALGLACAVILAAGASASDARERGRCVSAEPPATVVLPDGSRHDDARRLQVCIRERLTPTTCIHEIRVDGHPVGLFRSESGRSEDRAEVSGAVVVFERDRNRAVDEVSMWGYAVQEGERLRVFRLERAARGPGM